MFGVKVIEKLSAELIKENEAIENKWIKKEMLSKLPYFIAFIKYYISSEETEDSFPTPYFKNLFIEDLKELFILETLTF